MQETQDPKVWDGDTPIPWAVAPTTSGLRPPPRTCWTCGEVASVVHRNAFFYCGRCAYTRLHTLPAHVYTQLAAYEGSLR